MKRSNLLLITVIVLSLVGCLPQTSTTPPLTPTTSPTPPAIAQTLPTAVVGAPSEQQISTYSGCTAKTQKPTPGATQETIYPPITDADYTKGPANARVTIIEYSDFQ